MSSCMKVSLYPGLRWIRSSLIPSPRGSRSPVSSLARGKTRAAMAARTCLPLSLLSHARKVSVCRIVLMGLL